MMKVHAQVNSRRGGGQGNRALANAANRVSTLRQRYGQNRAAGRGRVSSAANALRGRTPG